MLRSFLALAIVMTPALSAHAQSPTQSAARKPQTRAPSIDPALATFLAKGAWRQVPNADAAVRNCTTGSYHRFFRSDGRLKYDYSNTGTFVGALFTLGLTALRSDDLVTRIAAKDGEIEIDIAYRENGRNFRKRLVFERKDENLLNFTKAGEIKRGGAILDSVVPDGGLYKRCFEPRR